MAAGIATSNILAYENREDYGRNALINNLVDLGNADTLEEDTSVNAGEVQVYSYLEKSAQIESGAFTANQEREEEIYQQQLEAAINTQGELTLFKPELASTEAAKITRTSIQKYKVASGDSLGSIATKFNLNVNTLLWANKLTARTLIKPGQELMIPPTNGVIHLVKRGDTLAKIAKAYSASTEEIKEFNNINSDKYLVVGETIMVPGGRIIYTPAPRVAAPTRYAENIPNLPAATGGKMYWPSSCYRISQYFRNWRHTGVDIACPYGTSIRAAESGVVNRVQYGRTGYGYNIIIAHGGGKQTLYGHLSRIDVEPGQSVEKGEVIGLEGSTGRSTGPHLHFEVRINGSRVNPLNYIR